MVKKVNTIQTTDINSNLVINVGCDTKMDEIEKKFLSWHITTQELNKLMAVNFDARLKWAKLATKGDIADFVRKQQIFRKN